MTRLRPHLLRSVLLCGSLFCLAACSDGSGDPTLPEVRQFLLPPMNIARVVGWRKGETPSVAQGLKIEPLATGLQHPRSLYTLPNGDVLVVESKAPEAAAIKRPKEIVMNFIEDWATSGGNTGEQPHHAVARHQWRRHSG